MASVPAVYVLSLLPIPDSQTPFLCACAALPLDRSAISYLIGCNYAADMNGEKIGSFMLDFLYSFLVFALVSVVRIAFALQRVVA